MKSPAMAFKWDKSTGAHERSSPQTDPVFKSLFELSADAIWLYDPETVMLLDCNQAAVDLIGAENKQELLRTRPDEISPPIQPDGSRSSDKAAEIVAIVEKEKRYRFEWVIRRRDGRDVPVEVTSTALLMNGKSIHVIISRDIGERKKTEHELLELTHALEQRVAERTAALSASEARFRAMVEHAPEAIVVFNGETGRFLFGNEHACQLYGVQMDRLTALTPTDVSPEFQPNGRRSCDMARELMADALAGGMPVFEWVHQQQPDGRLIPTEVRLLRLPAEGQNLIRASIMDNTERKRAEDALRESEGKFRALFEGSSQGIVLHDEHEILEVNPAAVRIMGRQVPGELLGRHPREMAPIFQPNGERSDILGPQLIGECIVKGSARFEWLACAANGEEIPLEVALTRIQLSGRQIIQAFITDIRGRQRAQAALAESEARFSAAFQASPIFTSIIRLSDGKYVLMNDSLVNWLDCPREEVIGRTSAELGMWENSDERNALYQELLQTGFLRQRECRWRNRRGELFTILLSAEMITLDNEPHILCLDQDISQRKKAEVEVFKALAREKELSQLKSNFVSMVSHEFRTPLGIIQSSAELLRAFYQKMQPWERDEQLESIARNTHRMAAVMEGVLVLSRLDAGKLEFQPSALDIGGFFRRVIDEVLSATNRRCPIELSLHAVPSGAEADEQLLGHIFTNLLSNAVKYSESGSKVRCIVERNGQDAVCSICDEGIGISEDDQQRLFKAFHRGGNVGTRPGTGLGLMLVKRCTELHGGKVRVHSMIGRGTTVTVILPVFGNEL